MGDGLARGREGLRAGRNLWATLTLPRRSAATPKRGPLLNHGSTWARSGRRSSTGSCRPPRWRVVPAKLCTTSTRSLGGSVDADRQARSAAQGQDGFDTTVVLDCGYTFRVNTD